jgi:hypothetical protein
LCCHIYEQSIHKEYTQNTMNESKEYSCALVGFLTADTWTANNGCATTCSMLPINNKTNKLSKQKYDSIILSPTLKKQHGECKETSSILKN